MPSSYLFPLCPRIVVYIVAFLYLTKYFETFMIRSLLVASYRPFFVRTTMTFRSNSKAQTVGWHYKCCFCSCFSVDPVNRHCSVLSLLRYWKKSTLQYHSVFPFSRVYSITFSDLVKVLDINVYEKFVSKFLKNPSHPPYDGPPHGTRSFCAFIPCTWTVWYIDRCRVVMNKDLVNAELNANFRNHVLLTSNHKLPLLLLYRAPQ